MAYIKDKVTRISAEDSASFTMPISVEHATDDLLIAFIGQDSAGGNADITTATTGWTLIGTQGSNGGTRAVVYYKVATSGSEANLVLAGKDDAWVVSLFSVGGADTTTPINAFQRDDVSGSKPTSTGVTTTSNNCLVFSFINYDNITYLGAESGSLTFASRRENTVLSAVGYNNQDTAGATPTIEFFSQNSSEAGQIWTIAVKDATPTTPKMSPSVRQVADVVLLGGSFANVIADNWDSNAPSSLTATAIATYSMDATTCTLSTTNILSTSPYGAVSRLISTTNTAGVPIWCGGVQVLASAADFTDKLFAMEFSGGNPPAISSEYGYAVVLEDSSGNWSAFELSSADTTSGLVLQVVVDLTTITMIDSAGTLDVSDITKIGFLTLRDTTGTAQSLFQYKNLYAIDQVIIADGCVESPVTYDFIRTAINGWDEGLATGLQGSGQVLVKYPVSFGNGTNKTYLKPFAQSNELPLARVAINELRRYWFIGVDGINNELYLTADDVVDINNCIIATDTKQIFTINASSSGSATVDFAGSSFVGYEVNNNVSGIDFNDCAFASCYQITLNGGGLDTCTVSNNLNAIAVTTNNPANITGTRFTSAGTGHAVEITATGTFDFLGNAFTGYGADGTTDAAIYNNSGGAVTLTLAEGDAAPTVRNGAGASTTIDAFVDSVGVAFSGLVAGSQVVVYTAGTTTELFRTDSSGTTASYDEVTTSLDLDYTIMKAGFVPIRVAGLSLTSIQNIPVEQVVDRAYEASSGLTFNTNAFATTGTSIFDLTTASTVQNFYSFMIESWIAETTLRNVSFPIEPNGPNSYTFSDGWEWADQDAIDFLSRDGMRYTDAGVVTAEWLSILSIGAATGFTGRYQQVIGATPVDAIATGVLDQLIQISGDATHGNFDYTDYLVLKYQVNGYFEAKSDVVGIYGTLLDEAYVAALEPQAIPGFTTGDPSVTGLAITNHGASPVSWDAGNGAKDYSITITDTNNNSAEDILRWINYNLSLGGTFQSDLAFNWPDLVTTDGSAYETVRGTVIDSAGALLKGVRVIRGTSTAHPGFTRFQSDDGTYGQAPVTNTAAVSNIVNGSRMQIYNVTTATEIYNDVVASTSYSASYTEGVGYSEGDTIRVRLAYQSGTDARLAFEQSTVAGASGWTVIANQLNDDVYNSYGIDGSAVTGFAADYTSDEIDVTVAADFTAADLYAWFVYNLQTVVGIVEFVGGVTALDEANLRINAATVDAYIDNTTATNIKQTDNIRIFRSDGAYPVKSSGGGGIDVVWRDKVFLAETGVSGLTPSESSQLSSITAVKSKTDNLTFTVAGQIDANIQYVNDVAVDGTGAEGDEWGPA